MAEMSKHNTNATGGAGGAGGAEAVERTVVGAGVIYHPPKGTEGVYRTRYPYVKDIDLLRIYEGWKPDNSHEISSFEVNKDYNGRFVEKIFWAKANLSLKNDTHMIRIQSSALSSGEVWDKGDADFMLMDGEMDIVMSEVDEPILEDILGKEVLKDTFITTKHDDPSVTLFVIIRGKALVEDNESDEE